MNANDNGRYIAIRSYCLQCGRDVPDPGERYQSYSGCFGVPCPCECHASDVGRHAPIGEDEDNCPCRGIRDCGCNCHYPVGPGIGIDGRGEPYVY